MAMLCFAMPPADEFSPLPKNERFNELQVQSQSILIKFLNTDLDLAFAMLQTARIESIIDPEEAPRIVAKVRAVVRAVRELAGRIQDRDILATIRSRTSDLEALIPEFPATVEPPNK